MTNQYPQLAIRIIGSNPDHHLWNNNGTWWIGYTIYPDPLTKQRIRTSLHTTSVAEARLRRDAIFAGFQLQQAA